MKRIASLLAAASIASTAIAADPVEFQVANLVFERPDGWAWVPPPSAMRKAQLAPPAIGESPAPEVVFFHFGPDQGGSVQANIQRWVDQFQGGSATANALQREEVFGGVKVTFVTATGTFLSGMPGGPTTPMPGYGLYAAILEGTQGNVFVKMTGPDPAVRAAVPAFESMISAAAGGS